MCSAGRGCTVLCVRACVCLWARARDGTGRGDMHVTHSKWKCYGLRVTCIFCVAIEKGRYERVYHVFLSQSTPLCSWWLCLTYNLLNHKQPFSFFSFTFSILYCLFLCLLLPLFCALSSVFFLLEEKHSPFSPASVVNFCLVLFVEAQWSVTYWPLDRFQTTHCSCGYRIDVRAGTALLQITRSAFSI